MNRGLRIYTRKNLKQTLLQTFFRNLSVTHWIILVNVVVFVVATILFLINQENLKYFALNPNFFMQGKYLWTLLISMFSHVYLWHLFANMITLMFIGGFVERLIGRKRYLRFYLISGIVASLFFVLLAYFFGGSDLGRSLFGSPEIFALGASGAVFGLAGLITVLIPRMKVLAFFIIPMQIWVAMVFFLGFFWALSVFYGLPIGNSAHLGGFVTGMIYGAYLRNKFPRKVARLGRMVG
ncbi:MAG: rhomboid family intramembrane serine protease [Nanoarchaeota archaeon]|nr:rhomboid family intramembrane serine protease [Nanoarchaeota archaeon]